MKRNIGVVLVGRQSASAAENTRRSQLLCLPPASLWLIPLCLPHQFLVDTVCSIEGFIKAGTFTRQLWHALNGVCEGVGCYDSRSR